MSTKRNVQSVLDQHSVIESGQIWYLLPANLRTLRDASHYFVYPCTQFCHQVQPRMLEWVVMKLDENWMIIIKSTIDWHVTVFMTSYCVHYVIYWIGLRHRHCLLSVENRDLTEWRGCVKSRFKDETRMLHAKSGWICTALPCAYIYWMQVGI